MSGLGLELGLKVGAKVFRSCGNFPDNILGDKFPFKFYGRGEGQMSDLHVTS